MAENDEGWSDGSDIDIEYDNHGDDFIGITEPETNGGDVEFLDENEEDADFNGYQDEWVSENFHLRQGNPFKKPSGATILHLSEASAGQYMELFWTDELFEKLVQETNNYASQELGRNPSSVKGRPWRPVELHEIKVFIALCFSMGILRLPDKSDYWRQTKWLFSTNFNRVMSRDRFFQLWRFLHIQNNEVQSETPDKLWKIRWLLDFLNTKFTELYVPHGNATVDDYLIKFKGKLSFSQNSSKRPKKRGVKIYALAESETGYMSRFKIYTGKENNHAHTVVMDLCQHYFGSNLCVYMDNFYTSPKLLMDLHSQGIMACGSVKWKKKGLPQDLLPSKVNLEKHNFKVAQKDNLTYCVWQDMKPVTVISNFHDPLDRGKVSRLSADSGDVVVPLMVADHQKFMKGVDLCDQMVGYYLLNHRSKKWWRCIFFHLMIASAHNAYIVAKDTQAENAREKWPGFQDFLEDIVEDLIGDSRSRREPPKVDRGGMTTAHDIVKLFSKNKTCRECVLSRPQGERKGVTKFGCKQCDIPVHLECSSKHFKRKMNVE